MQLRFFKKQGIGVRQVIFFELNPSKGSGVIEIPRKLPIRGGEWKKNCLVFSGPSGNCVQILGLIRLKKWTNRQTNKHPIALEVRIAIN